MKKRSCFSIILLAVFLLTFLSACGEAPKSEPAPEIGKWHADIKLSDMDTDDLEDEDKALFTMLAGNVVMGVDAEFLEDGSFSYTINTDAIKEEVSKSIAKVASWFIDFDVSLFTDRIVESAMDDVISGAKTDYLGDYTKEDGIIKAVDGDVLLFKIKANKLIQIDDDGNQVIAFSKNEAKESK